MVPSSVVVGDFNGDQRLDMAVINDNGLTVLLNRGNGAFLAVPVPGFTDVGQGPASLVAGDFNGDGKLDLAVATAEDRPGGGCITVLLGLGDGTFQQASHFDVHGTPSALVAADFDGDGTLDLAVATIAADRPSGGCITELLGLGNCSFLEAADIPIHGIPTAMVTGDFNLDGIPDLAVATATFAGDRPGGGCITVLLGLGGAENGGFQEAFDIPVDGRPTSLVAGDFNGDGIPDLAVGTVEDRPGGGCITVLLGQVNGGFQQAFHFDVSGIPAGLVAGDFNGDGKLDLAVATVDVGDRPGGGGCIDVLLGQGDGSFQQAFDIHVHGHPSALVAGDFNGDGKLDLAVANNESVTVILFANGDFLNAFISTYQLTDLEGDSPSESGETIQTELAMGDFSWSSP